MGEAQFFTHITELFLGNVSAPVNNDVNVFALQPLKGRAGLAVIPNISFGNCTAAIRIMSLYGWSRMMQRNSRNIYEKHPILCGGAPTGCRQRRYGLTTTARIMEQRNGKGNITSIPIIIPRESNAPASCAAKGFRAWHISSARRIPTRWMPL